MTDPADFSLVAAAAVALREGRLTARALAEATLDRSAAQDRLTAELAAAMDGCDLLLTAATLTPALPFSAFDGETAVWTPMRTIPFNLTGQPAMTLPCGFDQGLPLGLQLAARHGDEDLLCRAGHAYERATDHSVQRPPV